MEINKLKADIINHTPEKFYIFTGEEWKIQWIYIEKMSAVFEKPLKYIDSITDVYGKLSNKSLISQSYLYVVRDDTELINNETLQNTLEKLLGDNILILLLTNVDKRTKFYKKYSDAICIFDHLSQDILRKYIDKEISLSEENSSKLMEICEYDYGRCLLEIDKIKRYRVSYGENDIFDNDSFRLLLESGAIYQPPKDAIFDFIEEILDRTKNVFHLYEQCKAVNEPVMVILSVLYNNAKATLQVQSYSGKDLAKATGLNYFQIQNAKKHSNKRPNSNLIYIMELCQKCQEGIVTGTMDEEFVLDYILGEIL